MTNQGAPAGLGRRVRRALPDVVKEPLKRSWDHVSYEVGRRRSSDPAVRDWQERLTELRGEYTGRRCFIMGNGPSLNEMELERFEGEHVWGSNRCSLLFDRISWRPSLYVAVDERVVPDSAEEISELQQSLLATRFFFPMHYRLQDVLETTSNTWWYRQLPLQEHSIPWGWFSRDASQGVYAVYTVTVAALQLAVHLGFNPIYLFGCDTSYSVSGSVKRSNENADHLTSTADDDANHFDPRYFGTGRKWHEPHVERMISHYKISKAACDALGVEVYNATVGGALEVFPRVDYRELV